MNRKLDKITELTEKPKHKLYGIPVKIVEYENK